MRQDTPISVEAFDITGLDYNEAHALVMGLLSSCVRGVAAERGLAWCGHSMRPDWLGGGALLSPAPERGWGLWLAGEPEDGVLGEYLIVKESETRGRVELTVLEEALPGKPIRHYAWVPHNRGNYRLYGGDGE